MIPYPPTHFQTSIGILKGFFDLFYSNFAIVILTKLKVFYAELLNNI